MQFERDKKIKIYFENIVPLHYFFIKFHLWMGHEIYVFDFNCNLKQQKWLMPLINSEKIKRIFVKNLCKEQGKAIDQTEIIYSNLKNQKLSQIITSLYGTEQYQCLVTHYLSNFKKPFHQIEDETPEVIQIELLKRFHATDNKKTRSNIFSIWYFPHWHAIDPAFSFIFHGLEHPEGYFDNQKNALSGLNMIADNPKIKEIVVKLRNDVPEKVRKTYMQFMEQILGNNISAKFRLVYNLSSAQAFPYVSIVVHDMFSSGFVESMWAGIPTIAMLPQEQGVPSRLSDREYWINSGVFVRDKNELFKSLLAWVEGKMPDNYEQMKTRLLTHCGLGSPTAGQALKSILGNLNRG